MRGITVDVVESALVAIAVGVLVIVFMVLVAVMTTVIDMKNIDIFEIAAPLFVIVVIVIGILQGFSE